MSIQVSALANGLRVASDTMDTVESVSLGLWVDAGTRHETPDINGISHLLEHMAFKGTRRRSALAIASEIEAVGGQLNAYTSREQTAYYAKVLKEDVPLALDILSDIVQHSTMDPEELERERTVVVQEIGQALDTPDDIIFDHFQATAYPQQALGRPVLGTAERVLGMSRDALFAYKGYHYSAPRMILAAAGRVDHDQLMDQAARLFDSLPPPNNAQIEGASYQGGEYREDRDLEQVHLVLGFDGVAQHDPDYYAAGVLSQLLGGGMSSRLFQEIREKRGLVYSIYSFAASYLDGGLFAIYAATGEKEAAELIPLLCDELAKATGDISEEELLRARAQIKAGLLMARESTSARVETLSRQLTVYGRPVPAAEMVEKLEAVTVADMRRVASRFLSTRPTLSAIGPLGGLEDFDKIRARLG